MNRVAHLRELQAAFKFTDDDLAANHAGYLSAAQRMIVSSAASYEIIKGVGLMILSSGFCCLFSFLAFSENTSPFVIQEDSRPFFTVIAFGLAVAIIWCAIYLFSKWGHVSAQHPYLYLSVMEGTIKKRKKSSGRTVSRSYFLRLYNTWFRVNRRQFNRIQRGLPYRVYFIAHINVIVAIEPL